MPAEGLTMTLRLSSASGRVGPSPALTRRWVRAVSQPARTPRICKFARLVASMIPLPKRAAASATARASAPERWPSGSFIRQMPPSRAATIRNRPGQAQSRPSRHAPARSSAISWDPSAIAPLPRHCWPERDRGRLSTPIARRNAPSAGFARDLDRRQVSWLAGPRRVVAFPAAGAASGCRRTARRLQLRGQPRHWRDAAPCSLWGPLGHRRRGTIT